MVQMKQCLSVTLAIATEIYLGSGSWHYIFPPSTSTLLGRGACQSLGSSGVSGFTSVKSVIFPKPICTAFALDKSCIGRGQGLPQKIVGKPPIFETSLLTTLRIDKW